MAELPALGLEPLPDIHLKQMLVLTDDTGILQHATHATPALHHGYCTDDNARALIAAVKFHALQAQAVSPSGTPLWTDQLATATQRYLAFLAYAFNPQAKRFRNFMGYDRTWQEDVGSEDSEARALWSLGTAVRTGPTQDVRGAAEELLHRVLPVVGDFGHIRPWAYALLGLDEYLRSEGRTPHAGGQEDSPIPLQLRQALAARLFDTWNDNALPDWPWWEDSLTWGNAKMPHALLVAGFALGREDMVAAALKALRWLLDVQTGDRGQLSIIGNRGWYLRGKERARFDQQPIEAKGLVQACLAAAGITRDKQWTDEAVRCFEWFTGHNDVGLPLYNPQTGGCQDGLGTDGVNANQGAESTLAYLISVLELHHYDRAQKASLPVAPPRAQS